MYNINKAMSESERENVVIVDLKGLEHSASARLVNLTYRGLEVSTYIYNSLYLVKENQDVHIE